MIGIELLAILVLAVLVGEALVARRPEAISKMWPVISAETSKGEPAEEGALIPEGDLQLREEEPRKAA